jgi:hypothetical protein
MSSDRVALASESKLTFAFKNEEHLLLAMMVVERALSFARREYRQVVAKFPGSDGIAELGSL